MTDFAHTPAANRNRRDKAVTVARLLWKQCIDADTAATLDAEARQGHEAAAGVRTTHPDEMWGQVADILREHPPPMSPEQVAATLSAPDPGPEPDPGDGGPNPEPPDDAPKGWPALVAALAPFTRPGAACGMCGERRVIVGTPERFCCCAHPPQPGEWGHNLDWAPRDGACLSRCYCGRCPHYVAALVSHTPESSTLVDDRAVASGKRRSSEQTWRAARSAEETRQARERTLRDSSRSEPGSQPYPYLGGGGPAAARAALEEARRRAS